MPLLAGFIVSRIIADPLFVFVEAKAPMAFAPTDVQKVSACDRCTVLLRKSNHFCNIGVSVQFGVAGVFDVLQLLFEFS